VLRFCIGESASRWPERTGAQRGVEAGDERREVLRTATTAILSEEALGAHMQDRNDERIDWALRAMQAELGHELGVELKPGWRHGLHRPR
jgi:hypothetical protein